MHEPATDAFSERRKNLEDAFFKDRDQQLMDKMRRELESFEESKKLAHVSGITEERVLKMLVQAGVRAETLTAVSLIPLVEVAWCDGSVSIEERDAVLNAAAKAGIQSDTAPYELLREWLKNKPDPHIIEAWRDYVSEMARLMPAENLAEMKRNMIDRCTRVAEAAGGFLGLSTISKHERAKIDELATAWVGKR
jgi:predicted metalloendopeptidase